MIRLPKAVVVVGLLLALPGGASQSDSAVGKIGPAVVGSPAAVSNGTPAAAGSLPVDWRWESYGGVEVAVPRAWGYGITGTPWCLSEGGSARQPYVGRPGPVRAILCPRSTTRGVSAGARVSTGGTFVWFADAPDPADPGDQADPAKSANSAESAESAQDRLGGSEGDREVITLGPVRVAIQAPAALRRQIRSTMRRVSTDSSGCPVSNPLPRGRPSGATAVADLTGVSSVTACRYAGSLFSSLRLTGPAAGRAIAAVAAAPVGGGPNDPPSCATASVSDRQGIVLLVTADQGSATILLRYQGCDHHGFDDGHAVRTLTRDAVEPFVAGPNAVNAFSGELAGVLRAP
jgi:hypothetical protein